MDVMLNEKNPVKKLVDNFTGKDVEMWWNADQGKMSIYYIGYSVEQKERLKIIIADYISSNQLMDSYRNIVIWN